MIDQLKEFHSLMIPTIIGFIICNVVGCLGNITVIYVYSLRYPRNHFRFLVLALSIVDFTSCCTTVPMETVSTWLWFDAPSSVLCKTKNFFIQFTGLSAIYMLFVMAFYKYRRICKPLRKQLTQRTLIIVCCLGFGNSLAFATPTIYFWDINSYNITYDNTTEISYVCEVQRSLLDTPFPRIYRHILSAYNICLFATIGLYINIAKTIIKHKRQMEKRQNGEVIVLDTLSPTKRSKHADVADFDCNNVTGLDLRPATKTSPSTSENQNKADIEQLKVSLSETVKRCKVSPTRPITAVASSSSQITSVLIRKVVIMVILSGTFAVTFLLGQVFGYTFAIRGFKDFGSLYELRLLFTFDRLYFLNYAINPVVYFALDRHFRTETFALVRCLMNA